MTACPTCGSEVMPGSRWCNLCHFNVLDPNIGKLASPGKRLGAMVLDFVILFLAFIFFTTFATLIFTFIFARQMRHTDASGLLISFPILTVAAFLAVYLILVSLLYAKGQTPGKAVLGMYVVKENGQRAGFFTMLFREWIGKLVSGMLFGLGYLWILIDRDRQAWHDKLASTYVVQKRP